MIEDKHEEILSRMGAILSQGIINAAGRNATISFTTRDGSLRQNAVVGLVMFLQYWYWYPMLNFITLSLTPTALIGLNDQLKVPKSFTFISNAKPSAFKYPEFLKKNEGKEKQKVETAVLSTTVKVKARNERKQKEEGMQVDEGSKEPKAAAEAANANEESKEPTAKEKEEEKAAPEPEPEFQELKNPSRVVKAQEKKITFVREGAYLPVVEERFGGFVLLKKVGEVQDEKFYDDEERDEDAPNPD